MLKISKDKLPQLLAALQAVGDLYVPAKNKAGKTDFALYTEATILDLDTHLTAKSLKDIFFPQVETMLAFKTQGKHLSIETPKGPERLSIAFGVRACDIRSFEILDKVFLKEPVDTYYQARRENTLLIGLGCSVPEETCFCGTFGIDAAAPAGDVATWLVGEELYWEAVSEKGKQLTAALSAVLVEAADKAPVELQQETTRKALKAMPLGDFKIAEKITADELKTFNSSVWPELASGCLSCCSCTFVCPTCHCYDIRDYQVSPEKIERFRCWDSCMNKDFTKMAAVNPRKTKVERFRQRYMHKLVYFPENNEGTYACVGCGRCLAKCPVHLNIVKVAKALEVTKDV